MAIAVGIILLALVLSAVFGWVVDSRDGGDWAPTADGLRQPRRGT